jgi:hypothetical protein
MASPSGRACETTTKRRRARMASATWAMVASVDVVVIGRLRLSGAALQNLLDPVLVARSTRRNGNRARHARQLDAAAIWPAEERARRESSASACLARRGRPSDV